MVVVYELHADKDVKTQHPSYWSIAEAREDLVEFGTDMSKRLFAAAQIAFEINHPEDAANPVERDNIFLLTVALMGYNNVVLAGETEAIEDIAGVGIYTKPFTTTNHHTDNLLELAALTDYQKNGYGSALLQHIETSLSLQGEREMRLTARSTAIPFYEKNGYAQKPNADPRTMYKMYKELSSI